MHDDAEAGVVQQEAHGVQRVAPLSHFDAVHDVEEHRERQVGGHREAVGHGQPAEDVVDRRTHRRPRQDVRSPSSSARSASSPTWRQHRRPRQHDDVGRVGDDA